MRLVFKSFAVALQFARRVKRKLQMRPESSAKPDTRRLESRAKRIVPISVVKTSTVLGTSGAGLCVRRVSVSFPDRTIMR